MRRLLAVALILSVVGSAGAARGADGPAAREGATHAVPLHGTVLAPWDAPEDKPFAAGHRGIDVAAPAGTPVRASASGVVVFAGNVAGNRTVSIDHPDGVRTTYSFLGTIVARANTVVTRGDVIATVGPGHAGNGAGPHVHLSARRGDLYFDPVALYLGTSSADLIALIA